MAKRKKNVRRRVFFSLSLFLSLFPSLSSQKTEQKNPHKNINKQKKLTNDLRRDHGQQKEDRQPHLADLDRRGLGHVVDQRERAVVGMRAREPAPGVEQQHVPGLEAHVADVGGQRHARARDADDDGVVAGAEARLADRPADDRRVGGDGGLDEPALEDVNAELLDLLIFFSKFFFSIFFFEVSV